MRKWVVVGMIYLLFPWVASMAWMWKTDVKAEEARTQEIEPESEDAAQDETEVVSEHAGSAMEMPLGEKRILIKRDGISTYMDVEEYLPGAVVCQAISGCEMEALKCQAVITRTYIRRLMEGRNEIHEEELDLDYLGEGDRGILWNKQRRDELFSELERCGQAVAETKGVVIQYEGRCILPLFHRMSGGRTRRGEEDFPYLQPAESVWDTKQEDFFSVRELSVKEFSDCIDQIPNGGELIGKTLKGTIQIVEKDDSGYVKQIKIGARVFSGEEFQYALSLPSSCYTVEILEKEYGNLSAGEKVRILTRGQGHGYGLSQTGADAMAKEGWKYDDILNYYYKNISLISE